MIHRKVLAKFGHSIRQIADGAIGGKFSVSFTSLFFSSCIALASRGLCCQSMSFHSVCPSVWTSVALRRHRRQSISPTAIDITVPFSVCLSRSCIVLKRQKIWMRFLLPTTAPCISQNLAYISQLLPPNDPPLLI